VLGCFFTLFCSVAALGGGMQGITGAHPVCLRQADLHGQRMEAGAGENSRYDSPGSGLPHPALTFFAPLADVTESHFLFLSSLLQEQSYQGPRDLLRWMRVRQVLPQHQK